MVVCLCAWTRKQKCSIIESSNGWCMVGRIEFNINPFFSIERCRALIEQAVYSLKESFLSYSLTLLLSCSLSKPQTGNKYFCQLHIQCMSLLNEFLRATHQVKYTFK